MLTKLSQADLGTEFEPHLTTQQYGGGGRIAGVRLIDLRLMTDDGGSFAELVRLDDTGCLEAIPEFQVRQSSYSLVLPGAIKAFHLHFNQEDVWFVPPTDRLLIGLVDARKDSLTSGATMRFVLGAGQARLLHIPRGVGHGCANVGTEPAAIVYYVNQRFDLSDPDERRLPWDILGADFWQMTPGVILMPNMFPTVYWSAWNCDATFTPGAQLPPESEGRLWAALAFVFYGDQVALADIEGRGLCIPSGRIEPGETVDEAAAREAWEETGAKLHPERRRLIGCYCMTPRDGSHAGVVRYCPVFVAEAWGFEPIPAGSESRGLVLAAVEDVADVYFIWDALMAAVFAYAEERKKALFPIGFALSALTKTIT